MASLGFRVHFKIGRPSWAWHPGRPHQAGAAAVCDLANVRHPGLVPDNFQAGQGQRRRNGAALVLYGFQAAFLLSFRSSAMLGIRDLPFFSTKPKCSSTRSAVSGAYRCGRCRAPNGRKFKAFRYRRSCAALSGRSRLIR